MINAARTLLMNVSSDQRQVGTPGEEYVPNYRPKRLTTPLLAARRILFGANPDRLYLNYRLREYMTLLHSTELEEFVTELDSRITYWPLTGNPFLPGDFLTQIEQIEGLAGPTLSIQGTPVPNLRLGRLFEQFRIEVSDVSQVRVTKLTIPRGEDLVEVTITNGLSSLTPLPQTSMGLYISTTNLGSLLNYVWMIETRARPTEGIDAIFAKLRTSFGEPNLIELFGVAPQEPYRTFRNLWLDHDQLAYQLGGFLLAVIYRTNEITQVD